MTYRVGESVTVLPQASVGPDQEIGTFDRQVRAWGANGQGTGSVRTVDAERTPIARAAAARSAPYAVALFCPPVVPYSSLSQTMTTRFRGAVHPIVASDPRFMRSEPSPSSTKTRRSGRAIAIRVSTINAKSVAKGFHEHLSYSVSHEIREASW